MQGTINGFYRSQVFRSGSDTLTKNRPWKQQLDPNLYSPVVGPINTLKAFIKANYPEQIVKKPRHNKAQGQPPCGVLGDRAYVGSGTAGRLFSIPREKEQVASEKVWRVEPNSEFPEPYRKTDARRCLGPTSSNPNGDPTYDIFPNYRQAVGIATTPEG